MVPVKFIMNHICLYVALHFCNILWQCISKICYPQENDSKNTIVFSSIFIGYVLFFPSILVLLPISPQHTMTHNRYHQSQISLLKNYNHVSLFFTSTLCSTVAASFSCSKPLTSESLSSSLLTLCCYPVIIVVIVVVLLSHHYHHPSSLFFVVYCHHLCGRSCSRHHLSQNEFILWFNVLRQDIFPPLDIIFQSKCIGSIWINNFFDSPLSRSISTELWMLSDGPWMYPKLHQNH